MNLEATTAQPLQPLEEYLRERVQVEVAERERLTASVSFAAELQGPPDTAHGGAVTAMLLELVRLHLESRGAPDALADPVEMEIALHRALPVDRTAQAEVRPDGVGWESRLLLEGRAVAEAAVRPAARPPACPDAVMAR